MDIICINDSFSPEQIAIIPNRPVEGKFYSIREVIPSQKGTALLLNEIHNPKNGWTEINGMKFTFEPSFSIDRFTNINGDTLTAEMLKEIKLAV